MYCYFICDFYDTKENPPKRAEPYATVSGRVDTVGLALVSWAFVLSWGLGVNPASVYRHQQDVNSPTFFGAEIYCPHNASTFSIAPRRAFVLFLFNVFDIEK